MILSKAANSYRAGTNDVIFVVVVSVRDNDSFLLHHVVFYLRRVASETTSDTRVEYDILFTILLLKHFAA